MGQLSLTIYVGHLLALTLWAGLLIRYDVLEATMSVTGFTVLAALAAVMWRKRFSRGPLEAALRPWSWPSSRGVSMRRPGAPTDLGVRNPARD
jgi:uncharacterized membrane protein YeiB